MQALRKQRRFVLFSTNEVEISLLMQLEAYKQKIETCSLLVQFQTPFSYNTKTFRNFMIEHEVLDEIKL